MSKHPECYFYDEGYDPLIDEPYPICYFFDYLDDEKQKYEFDCLSCPYFVDSIELHKQIIEKVTGKPYVAKQLF